MFSLNRVHLIGYQTQPVTVRQTPSGTSVTDLNLVVPFSFRTESGETLTSRGFFTVTVWGAIAEVAGQFVRPGAQIFAAGRLQTDTWEDAETHEKRSKTKIVATEMILLDPKSGQMQPPERAKSTLSACNRADIIGNVTRDPELRTTTSGQHVLTLGVATNDRWKDRISGELKERAEFHSVVVWGDLAEEVQTCIKKGQRVYVSGRVQTRSWETQAGSKRTTTEIIAEAISLLGVKNAIAEESIQLSDTGVTKRSAPAGSPTQEPEPALSVPDIQYGSEIKVEDLPF